jgi:hypothetical protein
MLLLSACALVFGSSVQADKRLVAVLSIAASLCSGLLGGVVARKWGEHTERQVLVARGRSAIRNLRLLLSSVRTMEKRVEKYLARLPEADCGREVVKTYLEEVLERCVVLHDEGINAIENWTDIIPEADITTQIGKIGDLELRIAANVAEIDTLRQQLSENKNRSEAEIRAAQDRVCEKEKEVADARAELTARRSSLGGVYTGSVGTFKLIGGLPEVKISGGNVVVSDNSLLCKKCGGTMQSGVCMLCGGVMGTIMTWSM